VIHDPSPACENAVVMPHVGQGLSKAMTQVHWGIPSWVWVACPPGFGVSHAAVVRTNRENAAMAAAAMRSPVVALRGVVRSRGMGAVLSTSRT
jgi:hypothetical protein